MLLVDHFLAEFDAKHKPSKPAKSAPRAIAKLRKQVRKTKEILSANKEAPISVEGMHEDHDFRSSIKRSSFESLAESVGLFDRAVAPLKAIVDALPEYNLTLKDLEVVEVIGGATRVPGVKAALQAAETCSVVVTSSKRAIEVAAVTNSNPEGVALLERLDNGLRQNEAKLHARGTGFAIVNDVPVNQLFQSPL